MPTFLQPSFWFTIQPADVTHGVGRFFLILFALACIASITLRIVFAPRPYDRYVTPHVRRARRALSTMGLFGLLLAFLSFENLPTLGARFWYPIWVIAFIAWAVVIVRSALKRIPLMRAQALARREREKYLPGRR